MIKMHMVVRHLLRMSALAWFVLRGLRRHRPAVAADRAALRGAAPSTLPGGCFAGPLAWRGVDGELRVNGKTFHLKGVNYYGFETERNTLEGLDVRKLDDILKFLQDNKFNALRLPFSLKFALSYDELVTSTVFQDAELNGMTKRQLFARVVERAAAHNMLVLLDMHRLDDQVIPDKWINEDYNLEDVYRGWDTILGDLKGQWNVFGVDLKNEPHGDAAWGDGSAPDKDWNIAAQQIGAHLLEAHADWEGLVFVEGVAFSTDFRGYRKHPIDLGKPEWNERLVLSPHQYGPSVSHSALFKEPTFPNNLPAEWTKKWAFLKGATTNPVVIGEWGGTNTGKDKVWQDFFTSFLRDKCLNDQFTWDLNPTSADTGGLLKDDWTTPETEKLAVVARVQPTPSYLSRNPTTGQICLAPGAYADAKCAPGGAAHTRRRLAGQNIE